MSALLPGGRSAPLIADARIDAALHPSAWRRSRPIEEVNIHTPEIIQAAHGEYREAGARLHRTNTLGGSRLALLAYGLEGRCEAINNSASAAARGGAGPDGTVMGSLAPPPGHATGPLPRALLEEAYGEQIVYLSDTGVDFLLLEHFTWLADALRVVQVAKRTSDAPVLAQLRFGADGRTAEGTPCGEAARQLVEAGADALGISCGPAAPAAGILAELARAGVPLSVMLGVAGDAAPPPYPQAPALTPQEFADTLAALVVPGVAILGGCCGVTPRQIAALAGRFGQGAASS